ncbi:MAG TPA: carbamoyltransferase HypF [Candidatus Sulfopaludibacter sp.]|nr:carbamoyltransferase HypF [Candidatus Sulfopaludibacter sp.]
MNRTRLRIRLRGIVQGVGFRPFVHNLAIRNGLTGYVLNSSAGLVTEVEGAPAEVAAFAAALTAEAPPLAWIQDMETSQLAPSGGSGFEIRHSVAVTGEFALVSPDVATCAACLSDIASPGNRRYGYAFTNCTNCGPRYTIIRDIPYDRPNTTMAVFPMCPACQHEYDDPADRRFHAQPNACPVCGPSLSAPIEEARRRLAAGEILAIKGLGGFHLACDARNDAAVRLLRQRKRRSDKPFAVMVRDLPAAERLAVVTEADRASLAGPRHPVVILRAHYPWPAVAPGNPTLGVMLPYTPLHHLLFQDAPYDVLVMTSGNLSEEPIVVRNQDAQERLGGVADWFLTHDRDIYMRADDSVVRTLAGRERVLRRSRGFAPQTLDLGRDVPELLAVGGELKNAFCLTKGRHAILSQHIGDLENYETLEFFEETLANLKKLFRVEPRAVVHDLHPGYLSTRYALALPGLPKIGVQHHHAHIASCMLDNGLDGEVIGVAFDGTGYGTDGAIWGGEFLVAGYAGFTRRAHLRYAPLAGGDAAVREPWRAALAYVDRVEGVAEERQRVVRRMIETGFNTVQTSSCGRLFDAVAALIGLRREVTFEGQAAIELEAIADPAVDSRYDFVLDGEDLDFRPAMAEIAKSTESASTIAARFHNTVAAAIVETCRAIGGLDRVCLSGGTFQNMRLLATVVPALRSAGFQVYLHEKVPPNDGGLALGQAAIAAARGSSLTLAAL